MNILTLGSHGVLEYDQVKLWSDLGYDVFSPGGYEAPHESVERMRPAIPTAPDHPDLRTACIETRERHGDRNIEWAIDWAKADLPQAVIDWADVVIVDCYPERWVISNWDRIRDKRVVWRTIGQSNPMQEATMRPYAAQGMQIVRYSPAERRAFEPVMFAGEDALIRFSKDPADWYGWVGGDPRVLNFTQHDRTPHGRDQWTNWAFWEAATEGLPTVFGGPNSEHIGGIGAQTYDEMRALLRSCRAYLYTGTQPAPYTLGLIEAMMTGIPVVSIGPRAWGWDTLFEAHQIVWPVVGGLVPPYADLNDPSMVRIYLQQMLGNVDQARYQSARMRQRAIDLFSPAVVGPQWIDFLGEPSRVEFSTDRASVSA